MYTFAKLSVCGRLGQNPVAFESGGCRISLCVNRSIQDEAGAYQDKPEWYDVVIHNKQIAKYVLDNVKKGDGLMVDGQAERNDYESNSGHHHDVRVLVSPVYGSVTKVSTARREGTRQDTDMVAAD